MRKYRCNELNWLLVCGLLSLMMASRATLKHCKVASTMSQKSTTSGSGNKSGTAQSPTTTLSRHHRANSDVRSRSKSRPPSRPRNTTMHQGARSSSSCTSSSLPSLSHLKAPVQLQRATINHSPGMKALNELLLPENYPIQLWVWHLMSFPELSHVVTHHERVVGYVLCYVEGHASVVSKPPFPASSSSTALGDSDAKFPDSRTNNSSTTPGIIKANNSNNCSSSGSSNSASGNRSFGRTSRHNSTSSPSVTNTGTNDGSDGSCGIGHVTSLAVHPEFQNLGIATMLMDLALLEMARAYNCSMCKLHVREHSNPAALLLYKRKFNFETVDISPNYYDDGESALCMEKNITNLRHLLRSPSSSFANFSSFQKISSGPPPVALKSATSASSASRIKHGSISSPPAPAPAPSSPSSSSSSSSLARRDASEAETSSPSASSTMLTAEDIHSRFEKLSVYKKKSENVPGFPLGHKSLGESALLSNMSSYSKKKPDMIKNKAWKSFLFAQYQETIGQYRKLASGPINELYAKNALDIQKLYFEGRLQEFGYHLRIQRNSLNQTYGALLPITG